MAIDDGYTKALLHMDGANGSTTFIDESGKTWTANGNAQISTAQSVFGGASGLFDGTGDYLESPDSADWRLDGGSDSNEWTIDFRVRFTDLTTTHKGLVSQRTDQNNSWGLLWKYNTLELNFIAYSGGTTIINIVNSWTPSINTWYHVALVKQGVTGYKMFIDGTQIGTTQTDTSTIPNFTGTLNLGLWMDSTGATRYLSGYMDEFRLSKGTARWTSDFIPSPYPYPSQIRGGAVFLSDYGVM